MQENFLKRLGVTRLLILLILLAALPLTVLMAQKQQELRQRAEGPTSFQIHLETCLTKEGQNDPRHYPAFWSGDRSIPYKCGDVSQKPPGPGFYQNQTGKNLVLTKIVTSLDSTFAIPAELTNAFADICVYAPLANLPQAKNTSTQSEVLCTNQFLTSGQWTKRPQSAWNITLPGRGLLVQPGGIVACDAQIGTMENLNLQTASKFSCDLYFNNYDWDLSKPAVQSLRTPYLDEFFVDAVSRYAPHTNTRLSSLRTLGVWGYNGTKGKKTDVCLHKEGGGDGKWCSSVNEETNGSWASRADWLSFDEVLAPGDKIAATCHTNDTGQLKDCALYFMVEVPEGQPPLYPVDSIIEKDRNSYCNNHDPKAYPYVDGNTDATMCQTVLSQRSPGATPSPSPTPTPAPTPTPTPSPSWAIYNNNPIIKPDGGAENDNIYAPDVHKEGGIYKMWYGGQGEDGHDRIFYATSNDGINWQKRGLVIDTGSDWEKVRVGRPSVIYENDQFKMWYDGTDPGGRHVGYATSSDGFRWQKYPSNPVYLNAGAVDVKRAGNQFIMLYESGNGTYWAVGTSETNFTSQGLLLPKTGENQDAYGHITPMIYMENEQWQRIYFAGASHSCWCKNRIFLAVNTTLAPSPTPTGPTSTVTQTITITQTPTPTSVPGGTQLSLTITLPAITLIPGDINNDNVMNIADYNILASCFGEKMNSSACGDNKYNADLNEDGKVDQIDYNIFLRNTQAKQGD